MADLRNKGSKKDLFSTSIEIGTEPMKDYGDDQNTFFLDINQNYSCFPLRGLDDPNDSDFRQQLLYIEYGYRRGYSQWELFLSLFSFHNQTSNIWSHLIGFFCVIILGMQKWIDFKTAGKVVENIDMNSDSLSSWGDFFFQIYIICAAGCLALSATYHWFGCFSEVYHRNLLRLDLTGVGLLISGSFFPSMYYNFSCLPHLQERYMKLSLFVLVAGLSAPWIEFKVNGHFIRHYLLASLVVIGLIPCVHWYLVTPDVYRNPLLFSVAGLFFWYTLGFVFFISHFPERMYPKNVVATMLFPSHTLWHLCVLAAIFVWFGHIVESKHLLLEFQCKPYE